VCQPHPIGLGSQTQQSTVTVETVSPATLDGIKRGFLASIDQAFAHTPVNSENQVQSVGPKACDLNDFRDSCGIEAPKPHAGLNVLEQHQNKF
jgi:hypothetical protein